MNPEAPWPHLQRLAAATAAAGKALLPRLPVYPRYLQQLLQPAGKSLQQQGERQREWLDGTAGRDSPLVATLRLADAEGLARGSTWYAGAADSVPADGESMSSEVCDSTEQEEEEAGRDQQHAAPPAAGQQQHAQQQLKSSVPRVRRRSAARTWRVALGQDGLLEGCPGPQQVSAEVQRLLHAVLEDGHELDEADMELLFGGEFAGWRAGVRSLHLSASAARSGCAGMWPRGLRSLLQFLAAKLCACRLRLLPCSPGS